MRADPGAYSVFLGPAIGFDDNRAAGVVLSNFRHQLRILVQRACFFAVNSKIHERSAGHCTFAALPEFFQLLLNASDFDRSA